MIINPYNVDENTSARHKYEENKYIETNTKLGSNIPEEKKQEEKKKELENISRETEKHIISNYLETLGKSNVEKTKQIILEYIYSKFKNIQKEDSDKIAIEVVDKIFGYGILQKYIEDEVTTDVRAVGYNEIYIKKLGKWEKSREAFGSKEEFEEYVRYCVLKNDSAINNLVPIVAISDKKFNLRIEAGIRPVNIKNPSLVIRIHKQNEEKSLETLMVKYNMFDCEVYKFLVDIVENEKNIIICGRGGSGKTTLLRAIIDKIPRERSIVSNEETAELYLKDRNIIQREVIQNRDEKQKIDLERLTKHALIMSCDTIILGELKSSEANVFFDAISTGHSGYATVHADSSKNTIDRIIVLIKKDVKAQSYKEEFLRQLLASSIDYIVYMKDYKVCTISEVSYNKKGNDILCKDIFERKKTRDSKDSYIIKKEDNN